MRASELLEFFKPSLLSLASSRLSRHMSVVHNLFHLEQGLDHGTAVSMASWSWASTREAASSVLALLIQASAERTSSAIIPLNFSLSVSLYTRLGVNVGFWMARVVIMSSWS